MRPLLVALIGLAGCGGAPTTVLVTVSLPDGAAPVAMSASVYDRFGALALDAKIDHPGAGTLVVRNLADEAQPVRIVISAPPLLGSTQVITAPHQQVAAAVVLGTAQDRDGDGVPDPVDDCPDTADPTQASAAGDGAGDACRGDDLAAADAADAAAADLSPVILFADEFSGTKVSGWNEAITGGTATVSGGLLTISVAGPSQTVDLSTPKTFGVDTSVHLRVNLTAGQTYDHHALGYSNAAVSSNCGFGETEAAIFRGQDKDRYVETELGGTYSCDPFQTQYAAGFRVLDIVRRSGGVDFYENGALVRTVTTTLSAAALPIRLSAYTFTIAPPTPIILQVDYVRVTKP